MARPKKSKKAKVPPYVVLKFDPPQWHVRRTFATPDRDDKGRIIYDQVSRRCIPETADQAKKISDKIEAEYKSAAVDRDKPLTVAAYIQRYLATKKGSVARRTFEHDQDLFERYVTKRRVAKIVLSELKPTDVQNLIDEVQAAGTSAVMTRKLHIFISSAFNQAVKWKMLDSNPAHGVIVPRSKRTEKTAMTREETARFLDVCKKHDGYLVFLLAIETGMRPQEFLGLTWANLDLARGRAKVTQALATELKGGGFEIKDPKTDASYRTIVISDELRDRLNKHRSDQRERIERFKQLASSSSLLSHMKKKGTNFKKRQLIRKHAAAYAANFEKYDLVFPAENGMPMSRKNLNNREFKAALKKARIDTVKYSLQSLRHTNLSILADKMPPKQLQKHAGHSRITTTLEYYVHVDEDARYNAGDVFSQAVGQKAA